MPKINSLDVTSFLYPVGQNCYTAYTLNTYCLYVKHHLKSKPTYCNIELNHQYHTLHTFTHTLFSLYHTLHTFTHNTLFAHLYIVLVLPDIGSISSPDTVSFYTTHCLYLYHTLFIFYSTQFIPTPLYTPFLLWFVYILLWPVYIYTTHCLYHYKTWGLYPIAIPPVDLDRYQDSIICLYPFSDLYQDFCL